MKKERFELRKSHSQKKPWVVEDTASDPNEDAVLYHFTSEKKAKDFKAMMVAEHGN
jgi:hypothetical protein